jgi:hypothetical protein
MNGCHISSFNTKFHFKAALLPKNEQSSLKYRSLGEKSPLSLFTAISVTLTCSLRNSNIASEGVGYSFISSAIQPKNLHRERSVVCTSFYSTIASPGSGEYMADNIAERLRHSTVDKDAIPDSQKNSLIEQSS